MFRLFPLLFCICLIWCACKTSEPILVKKPSVNLTVTYWKLEELNGKPYTAKTADEVYLQLQADFTFKGFAGCNTFWGLYKLNQPQIRFSNINRTKKMCDEYLQENELIKTLEHTEAFIINDTRLQLLKLDGTIIAIFNAPISSLKK
jgi:heat shock protein HslJ